MKQIVIEQLKRHEGFRSKPYLCSEGKLTIGYGRNLEAIGISRKEAEILLENDLKEAVHVACVLFPSFDELSDIRQAVLINMAFNLGAVKLAGFGKLRKAIAEENFEDAAREMLDSKWARQVKGRAIELSELMRSG